MKYFPLLKKSLLEDFTIDAGWVTQKKGIDARKDIKDFRYGTLEYKDGLGYLTVFQDWPSNLTKVSSDIPLQRKDKIVGNIANDNTKYVYIPQIAKQADISLNKVFPVTEHVWNVNRFSICNFVPSTSAHFNKIILNYSLLNKWIPPVQTFICNWQNMDIKVKNSKPKRLARFTYKGQLFIVYLIGNVNQHFGENDRKVTYKNDSFLLIESENNVTTEESIYFSREFRKMLAVIIGQSINTTQLSKRGVTKENFYEADEDIYFLEARFKNINNTVSPLLQFKYKDDIQLNNLIPNWFNMPENFQLLIQDYLLTIEYVQSVENKLINLTEGIEAYYRDVDISLYEKIKRVLNALPLEIQDELEDNVGNLNDWAYTLKQTRVHIAHGENKKNVIINFQELSNDVDVLQYLVQYFILKELGMKISNITNMKLIIEELFSSEEI